MDGKIEIEARTLRELVDQARVAPPRSAEARYALLDAEEALRSAELTVAVTGEQLRLFDPDNH